MAIPKEKVTVIVPLPDEKWIKDHPEEGMVRYATEVLGGVVTLVDNGVPEPSKPKSL